MNDEIVFYHNPMSRGLIAHWMLEEVGVPYRVELVRLDQPRNQAYLAINPMGKVPTIVHRGVVVTEAAAICAYLADAFPKAELAPALDEPARGTYLRWLFFAADCFEAAVLDKIAPRTTTPPRSQVGYGSYADMLDTAEKALQPGPYVLGERFSAADVYLGSQLRFSLMTKQIEPRPSFESYVARLQARPAMKRVNTQSEALAAKLKG